MNIYEYETKAMRTAKDMGSTKMNLIHAALGVASDGGELVDAIKKHTVYGKLLDYDNVIEEMGDILWFLALTAKSIGTTLEVVMEANIEKLAKRYPEKYSDEAAIAREDKQHQIDVQTSKIIESEGEA